MDGDGRDDLLIGAPGDHLTDPAQSSRRGKSHLMLAADILAKPAGASFDLGTEASATFLGEADGDRSGSSVAAAGDMNNDGKSDLLIGAPYNDEGDDATTSTINEGKAYLILSPY